MSTQEYLLTYIIGILTIATMFLVAIYAEVKTISDRLFRIWVRMLEGYRKNAETQEPHKPWNWIINGNEPVPTSSRDNEDDYVRIPVRRKRRRR